MGLRRLLLAGLLLWASPVNAQDAPATSGVGERGRKAMAAGVEFLLRTQNTDGSWGYHAQIRPYRIYAPVPGAHRSFKVATTALALMALRRCDPETDRLAAARVRATGYLLEHARVKRSHGREIYNVWAFGYGLKALASALLDPREGDDQAAIRAKAKQLIKALALYQAVDGGWGYFDFRAKTYRPSGDSMSFTTATILLALSDARKAGLSVPGVTLRKALTLLKRCRTREKSYIYSYWWWRRPLGPINRPAGSLTRTPGCNLALFSFDAGIDAAELEHGVAMLLENRKFGRMGLHRPVPHESWAGVSGYFYLYGYYYAAECLRILPRKRSLPYRDGLIEDVLYTHHPDGSFWDYPFYGYDKPYGTSYAVLALAELTR